MERFACTLLVLVGAVGCVPWTGSRLEELSRQFPVLALPAVPSGPHAAVVLGDHGGAPTLVQDVESGMRASFVLEGSRNLPATQTNGVWLSPGSGPSGADVVQRLVTGGVEDFVIHAHAPAQELLTYQITLEKVAGLRLVENTLELLDAAGVPRLRVPHPYVVDARGTHHNASLSVLGCALDTNPKAPFGRPVTPPGAAHCQVRVGWSGGNLTYPVLVDPVWMSTANSMASARSGHTATLLSPASPASLVLVAGGYSAVDGSALRSAELYEPLSRRFSVTGSLQVARTLHTATSLDSLSAPAQPTDLVPVLMAGGADSAQTPLASLEVYDPATGVFVLDSNSMVAGPRFMHTATLVGDGVVLLAGGTSLPLNQPTNSAYVYTFSSLAGGVVQSALVQTSGLLTSSRTGHAALLLGTGKVLLTGGFVLAGGALQGLQNAEFFDVATGDFSQLMPQGAAGNTMSAQRGFHTMTSLGGGHVLVAGGLTKTVGGIYMNTADIFSDGTDGDLGFLTLGAPLVMGTGRARHTATRLAGGGVLLVGGMGPQSNATTSVELFRPELMAFEASSPLPEARGGHAALLVNAGNSTLAGSGVLVLGGSASGLVGSAAMASSLVMVLANGDACSLDAECLSGHCVGTAARVCCDTSCDGVCRACTAALKGTGVDGQCGAAQAGTPLAWSCAASIETFLVCTASGGVASQESNVCLGGCDTDRCAPYDAGTPDAAVELPDAAMAPPDAAVTVLDAAVEVPDAALMDMDAGTQPVDAAMPDAAMSDAAMPDAAMPDAAMPDAAMPDAAMPDAAMPDAAMADAARPDAAPTTDAAVPSDAAAPADGGGGDVQPSCGCAASSQDSAAGVWLLFAAVLLARRARVS